MRRCVPAAALRCTNVIEKVWKIPGDQPGTISQTWHEIAKHMAHCVISLKRAGATVANGSATMFSGTHRHDPRM